MAVGRQAMEMPAMGRCSGACLGATAPWRRLPNRSGTISFESSPGWCASAGDRQPAIGQGRIDRSRAPAEPTSDRAEDQGESAEQRATCHGFGGGIGRLYRLLLGLRYSLLVLVLVL